MGLGFNPIAFMPWEAVALLCCLRAGMTVASMLSVGCRPATRCLVSSLEASSTMYYCTKERESGPVATHTNAR